MSIFDAFWFVAGLLCALGLALLARPWLRGDSSLKALWTSLPGWMVPALLVATAAVVALYLQLGRPDRAEPANGGSSPHASGQATSPGKAEASSMEAVLAALESRLRGGGGSDADWELLAKSYEFLGRTADAALARSHQLPQSAATQPQTAIAAAAPTLTVAGQKLLTEAEAARRQRDYRRAAGLYRDAAAMGQMTADSWADYADASASLNGNRLAGDPERFITEALKLDPLHTKALWLQGSVEHETRRHAAAVVTWKKLLAQMDPASSDAKLITANIEEDQRLAGGPVAAAPAAGGARISGEVMISAALRSKVRAGSTLFILAKSVSTPGAPVAVIRTTVGSWPVRFQLDDSHAMVPGHNLSSAGQVTVEARVSASGQAASQPGDLLGATAAMSSNGAKHIQITIDREVG